MGPQGPIWSGIAPKRRHMGPLGPLLAGFASKPSRATAAFLAGAFFFLPENVLFVIFGPKMFKKKLRLRGLDLSGEIRAEILRSFPLGSCKTVGWRPIWCQKGVILGPLGFRARLAHPNQPSRIQARSRPDPGQIQARSRPDSPLIPTNSH